MMRTTHLHEGWRLTCARWLTPPGRHGFSVLERLPATVPGQVHQDLLAHGVIADPFGGLAELGCAWVDEEDWIYELAFEFVADPALPRRLLRFEGLDTVATVRLNGVELAQHDDMFVPLEVDVTGALRTGANTLTVELASALRVGRERRAGYFAAEGLPEDTLRFPEAAFVRKAGYMYGWDWGPRLVSAGLWGEVKLLEHAGRLTDVHVAQRHLEDGAVELRVRGTVEGDGAVLHFVEGHPAPLVDGEPLRLDRPERWFPAGLGPQRLHTVDSFLVPPGVTDRAGAERLAMDRRSTRVGLRTVRLVRAPDAFGESFALEVNGLPVWCVGANWIPDHSLPATVTPAQVRRQVGRARDLNMNMLRVWGGGLYESDAFYDACDELGVLVWQDFAYACSYYPDDAPAQAVARREAEAAVRRLRHHPSLALWCGNNENTVMFQDGWEDRARHPRRLFGQVIYDEVLPAVLKELDPDRPYVPTSPSGGTPVNAGGAGDQHCWDVWHGRGDWVHYQGSTARFASEFGFAAAPGHAALRRMAPAAADPLALPVRDRAVRWHDKTLRGYESFLGLVALHYPPPADLGAWSYLSQLNQRDALRHGIEHWRRSAFCRGALVWQLNDLWPAQSWAVVDSEGEYKAAAHELRRLFAPALLSLVVEGGKARLWAVLDNTGEPLDRVARLTAHSTLDGRVLGTWTADVKLRPGERRAVLEADLAALSPAETLLAAELLERPETRTFRPLAEPKAMRLGDPAVAVRAGPGRLEVVVDAPALDLFLWDDGGGLRLLDNFVTLAAPGRVVLRTEGASRGTLRARSLRGEHVVRAK